MLDDRVVRCIDMERILVIFAWYPLFLVPASIGFGILYVVLKKHSGFNKFHYLNLILPWCCWIGLMAFIENGKTLSNFIEAVILGGIVSLWFVFEAIFLFSKHDKQRSYSYIPQAYLIINCCMALFLWGVIPGLPV